MRIVDGTRLFCFVCDNKKMHKPQAAHTGKIMNFRLRIFDAIFFSLYAAIIFSASPDGSVKALQYVNGHRNHKSIPGWTHSVRIFIYFICYYHGVCLFTFKNSSIKIINTNSRL